MRERQETGHGAAGVPIARAKEERVKGESISAPGEELIAIDEIKQRHRFAARGNRSHGDSRRHGHACRLAGGGRAAR